jgi:hypothetical protein
MEPLFLGVQEMVPAVHSAGRIMEDIFLALMEQTTLAFTHLAVVGVAAQLFLLGFNHEKL